MTRHRPSPGLEGGGLMSTTVITALHGVSASGPPPVVSSGLLDGFAAGLLVSGLVFLLLVAKPSGLRYVARLVNACRPAPALPPDPSRPRPRSRPRARRRNVIAERPPARHRALAEPAPTATYPSARHRALAESAVPV